MKPYVVDFETEAIEDRPRYPPVPVGVSIRNPSAQPRYLAWGHPSGNNTTKEHAADVLLDIWRSPRGIVFHNAKFDLEVARVHFGLHPPSWDLIHDTMFLVFLKDPHVDSLGLKESAERILNMPPDERDRITEWLIDHNFIRRGQKPGPFISKCSGRLVAPYANGDVERTWALFEYLYQKLDSREMEAYDRERRLLPILLDNERQGIRFDIAKAEHDIPLYDAALKRVDKHLRKRLSAPSLNIDSDQELAEALDSSKVVTQWTLTKTGQRSVAKGNLTLDRFNDPEVFHALGYRNRLHTVLSLNLRPWLEMADKNQGKIFTEWNQVRQTRGDGNNKGTRTGRLSCSRFQNVVKDFSDRGDGYQHPVALDVPPLPLVRSYLLPDNDQLIYHRDYNQQEFRILAHYEDDALRDSYQKAPNTDYHTLIQKLLQERYQIDYGRRVIKTLNFGILYGMGAALLAAKTGLTLERASMLRQIIKGVTPGVILLEKLIKDRSRAGQPIRTWGGRLYYCEPPAWSEKEQREITFEYKLLNYLVQGSAADCTKEALIRYNGLRKNGRLLVTVHDEINISAADPKEDKLLKEAMESIEFDVPMLTDGKHGPSWGDLK